MHIIIALLTLDPDNTAELLLTLVKGIQSGNVALGISVGITLFIQLVRKLVLPNTKVAWLQDKRVVLGLGLALALAAGIAGTVLAGTPLTLAVVINIVVGSVGTWLASVGLFSSVKNAKEGGPTGPLAGQPAGVASMVAGKEPMEKLR